MYIKEQFVVVVFESLSFRMFIAHIQDLNLLLGVIENVRLRRVGSYGVYRSDCV